jgi:hypothetical protein
MTAEEFWRLIGDERDLRLIRERLAGLDSKRMKEFATEVASRVDRLVEAHPGAGFDEATYRAATVVAYGRVCWEGALAEPNPLNGLTDSALGQGLLELAPTLTEDAGEPWTDPEEEFERARIEVQYDGAEYGPRYKPYRAAAEGYWKYLSTSPEWASWWNLSGVKSLVINLQLNNGNPAVVLRHNAVLCEVVVKSALSSPPSNAQQYKYAQTHLILALARVCKKLKLPAHPEIPESDAILAIAKGIHW